MEIPGDSSIGVLTEEPSTANSTCVIGNNQQHASATTYLMEGMQSPPSVSVNLDNLDLDGGPNDFVGMSLTNIDAIDNVKNQYQVISKNLNIQSS
jgi:hypothetical protein